MRPSSGGISIAASTRKLDVDSRISLQYYYRIAENLLKQASIYREEKNLIDLYILLLRFSSLITETIPCHQDYQSSLPKEKAFYKKKLLDTLTELEKLKPVVQNQIEELNRKHNSRNDNQRYGQQNIYMDSSLEWPPVTKQSSANYSIRQVSGVWQPEPPQTTQKHYETPRDKLLQSKQIENQIRKMSLSVPKPREETLSRHSILGPTGLRGLCFLTGDKQIATKLFMLTVDKLFLMGNRILESNCLNFDHVGLNRKVLHEQVGSISELEQFFPRVVVALGFFAYSSLMELLRTIKLQ